MAYINAFATHFRAIQAWGAQENATVQLDMVSFQMEVKCRRRYFTFFPQFVSTVEGRLANTPAFTATTGGFAGWLPYRPLTYPLSLDKLHFKSKATEAGLRIPRQWSPAAAQCAPDADYILKRSSGSFGYELSGPFRAGTDPRSHRVPPREAGGGGGPGDDGGRGGLHSGAGGWTTGIPPGIPDGADPTSGDLYAEQYIHGRALKAWCWGATPFFAHVRAPAAVTGDGTATLLQLVQQRLARSGRVWEGSEDQWVVRECVAYQGRTMDDVPAAGTEVLIDYRYGRESMAGRNSLACDDDLPALPERTRVQIRRAASAMAKVLGETIPVPVAYSLDGVVDPQGDVWWLELNSNPSLPPEGYAVMFRDLFSV